MAAQSAIVLFLKYRPDPDGGLSVSLSSTNHSTLARIGVTSEPASKVYQEEAAAFFRGLRWTLKVGENRVLVLAGVLADERLEPALEAMVPRFHLHRGLAADARFPIASTLEYCYARPVFLLRTPDA